MSEIDIGAIYPLYKGAWSEAEAYDFLDMVTKDGSSYLCIAEATRNCIVFCQTMNYV